jgi:DNA-binding beta-propeller fold protein YncE
MKEMLFPFAGVVLMLLSAGVAVSEDNDLAPLLPQLANSPLMVVSTVPANGDLNPYGVAFVPPGFPSGGSIQPGDVLVSNFNNSANLQGTGRTIVAVGPHGNQTLFFNGPRGLGLTTALGVLQSGVVLVGNVPTMDGSFATVKKGSLIAIDRSGKQIGSFAEAATLDGPWYLAVGSEGGGTAIVFVANVLNGTVSRLVFDVSDGGEHITLDRATTIATGYMHRGDPNALVIGPTGLAFNADQNVLYVASTGDNAIYAVDAPADRGSAANKGRLVYRDNGHLRGPLGLVLAPNGDLIAADGDAVNGDPAQPSELVEFTPSGKFVSQVSVDTMGQGGAFGLAVAGSDDTTRFAAVDDVTNMVKIWQVPN